MNEKEVIDYIEYLNQFGSVLGLDTMKELTKRLGNPQNDLKFIHIAGTNGKGSTLAYLSTILKAAGYKVGRYISPTIFTYRERIQINGKSITWKALGNHLEQIREISGQMMEEGFSHPTAFEIETALGFLYFKEEKCDVVVLETGLGGLLDATNIVTTTVACVFASISMDHMAYLGNTLCDIALNKAGIIKNGCYVIAIDQEMEVLSILENACVEKNAHLTIAETKNAVKIKYGIEKQKFSYGGFQDLIIKLSGKYQISNAVLAVETIRILNLTGFTISEKALRKGLEETLWSGRFQKIADKPMFIVDGAHNEDGARKLAESIRFYFTNRKIIYIMGILKDKEYEKIIAETYAYAEHIITVTTPNNARSMKAYELAQAVKEFHPRVTVSDSLEEAVEISYLLADKDSIIIAFGSLSFIGPITKIVEIKEKMRSDSHGRSKKN